MTVQLLERTARTRLRRVLLTAHHHPDRSFRLPLHIKLFLIAHNDTTGQAHLAHTALCRGLAGAILLELWLTGRIQIGWRYDARNGVATLEPGLIRVLDPNLIGDPLTDAALAHIWRTGGALHVRQFVKEFATPDLHDRVRADMVATGVLHRVTRRRLLFSRREAHIPVHPRLSLRARSSVRDIADNPGHTYAEDQQSNHQAQALAGLVLALGLTRHVIPASPAEFQRKLIDLLAGQRDPAIRETVAVLAPRRHQV
ncbi:MAG TPA: GPP34 family phosphoprotein [Micromonosporaceae bacterium]